MVDECSECGEELIGNVNRCWRCGSMIVSKADSTDSDPVIDATCTSDDVVPVAYLVPDPIVESDDQASGGDSHKNVDRSSATDSTIADVGESNVQVRTGSPFRGGHECADEPLFDNVVMPQYPDNVLRENFAVASVVVAVMSLIASIGTAWSLISSSVSLGLGILGIRSERRRTAIVGVVLSCIAVFVGTWKTIEAVQTYYEQYEMQQMDELLDY